MKARLPDVEALNKDSMTFDLVGWSSLSHMFSPSSNVPFRKLSTSPFHCRKCNLIPLPELFKEYSDILKNVFIYFLAQVLAAVT